MKKHTPAVGGGRSVSDGCSGGGSRPPPLHPSL